jgi:hypothetical protein
MRFEGHHGCLDVEALLDHVYGVAYQLRLQRRRADLTVIVSEQGLNDIAEWRRANPAWSHQAGLPCAAVALGGREMARGEVRVLVDVEVIDGLAPLACAACAGRELRRMADSVAP